MISKAAPLRATAGVAIACAGTARAMRPDTSEAAVRLRAMVMPVAATRAAEV